MIATKPAQALNKNFFAKAPKQSYFHFRVMLDNIPHYPTLRAYAPPSLKMYQVTTTRSHNIHTGTHFLSHLEVHRRRVLSRGMEIPPHFFKFRSFSNSDLEDALTMFFPEHRPHLYPLSSAFPQSSSQSPLQGSFL